MFIRLRLVHSSFKVLRDYFTNIFFAVRLAVKLSES